MTSPPWLSFLTVLVFFAIMWLYVREFAVLSNTIDVKWLVAGAMLAGVALASAAIWRWRERFTPWGRHLPEVALILVFSVLFAPLFGSLLNRAFGKDEFQTFEFVSETAYFASGYGILKGEKWKPTGWRLVVREGGRERRLKYKRQAYYPLTKPGEQILLPVRKGFFGVRVAMLQ